MTMGGRAVMTFSHLIDRVIAGGSYSFGRT
jgi:hypothetical protein